MLPWALAAAVVALLWGARNSSPWKGFADGLVVTPTESKVDFCRAVGVLDEPGFVKSTQKLPEWAALQYKSGSAVVVDSAIQAGKIPDRGRLRVYAVDPKKVAELTSNGVFVEYKP